MKSNRSRAGVSRKRRLPDSAGLRPSLRAAWSLVGLTACALASWQAATAADAGRGKLLYPSSCSSCHGTDPTRDRNDVMSGANSASKIQRAIDRDKGGMGVLSGLSATDVADIAAYLGNPGVATPAPAPAPAPGSAPSASNGALIYSTACVACH